MKRILIIEDDTATLQGLTETLQEEQFEVLTAADGERGYELAKSEPLDLIILDLLLPKKNGLDLCKDLRREGIQTLILMLTSKTKEVDEIVGLEVGADDYITKPFSVELLLAHIHSLLRRQDESVRDLESYTFGNIVLDFKKLEASKNGNPITLAAKEFEILKFFILNEGKVVTRDMLLDDVWGYANKENLPTTRTVDSYILVLRKKIEDNPSHPKHLLTVHTKGYKFMK